MRPVRGRNHRAGEDKQRHALRKPTPCGLMACGWTKDQRREIWGGTIKQRCDVKAAPFKRNDAMLQTLPIGVMIFPGTGIHENLGDKAKKLGIPVWKFGGA